MNILGELEEVRMIDSEESDRSSLSSSREWILVGGTDAVEVEGMLIQFEKALDLESGRQSTEKS